MGIFIIRVASTIPMSLISSIFGEAPPATAAADSRKDSLFGVLDDSSAPKKDRSDAAGDNLNEEPIDDEDQSSDSADDGQQTTTSSPPANNNTKRKRTKEELKEEESRTIFVGNLPPDINRKSLAGIFKPCGAVASARLRSMAVTGVKLPPEHAGNQKMMHKICVNTGKVLADTPKKSAQGYVVFESVESIENALLLNNTTYQSHTIRVDRATPTIDASRSVFVGNLPYGADEETLHVHFADQLSGGEDLNEGEGSAVTGVRIIRDKDTQKCKGFGYVMLRDASLVPSALQVHGTTYMKRELRVMVCGKRTKGNRGGYEPGRRSFEGQRSTRGASSIRKQSSKRKSEEGTGGSGGGKTKRRRARSEKKAAPVSKAGMSKRATTEQKVKKRVKKLQKRVAKGMGTKK